MVFHVRIFPISCKIPRMMNWQIADWFWLLPACVWLALLLDPWGRWHFRPVDDESVDENTPSSPLRWPRVHVLVPARNEAFTLPLTMPALLAQDYPGEIRYYWMDDVSSDGTGKVARACLDTPLPAGREAWVLDALTRREGWMGKVNALENGIRFAIERGVDPEDFWLFTDADILHSPDSLRELVCQSLELDLGLNSRMARLRCESPAEKLLIPAFVYFFNLLYPMSLINNPKRRTSGAAGGCVLLSGRALAALGGGLECIRDRVIDDVNLGRSVKNAGLPIRLELSRTRVLSLREYPDMESVLSMIRRSAYAQLGNQPLLLVATLLGLVWLFLVPWAGMALGAFSGQNLPLFSGLAAVLFMSLGYLPAMRFFRLYPFRVLSLAFAALFYALATLESGLAHHRGKGILWREPTA